MLTEDRDANVVTVDRRDSVAVGVGVPLEARVGQEGDVATDRGRGNISKILVRRTVNERAAGLDTLGELAELTDVGVERREDVDMVPSDACQDSNIRVIVKEFRAAVSRGGQVFVAFEDSHLGGLAKADHSLEALDLSADHIVEVHAALAEDVHNHSRRRRLAVATAYDDTLLVGRLFVEVFREGVYLQTELLSAEEFRIVWEGVPAEDDGVEVRGNPLGVPASGVREQPLSCEAATARLEELVV